MNEKKSRTQGPYIAFIGGSDLNLRIPLMRLLMGQGYRMAGVCTEPGQRERFEKEGISFFSYPEAGGPSGLLKSLRGLYRVLRANRFDIVHAFDTKPTMIARVVARLAGIPLVIGTITGLGKIFSGCEVGFMPLKLAYVMGQIVASRMSDATVFQNEDDRDFFIKMKAAGKNSVEIIRGSGVDTRCFSMDLVSDGDVSSLRKALGMETGSVVVTMITRLVKYKGIQEFLDASRQLGASHKNAMFLLIGPEDNTRDGYPAKSLEAYPAVKYIGARRDIRELLGLSDIVVLPSYYREGIPRVLLEAASMGKPLVTTGMPGCREVVEDGRNGFLVPARDTEALADAISKLIADSRLRREMGERSLRKAKDEFEIGIIMKNHADLYQKLYYRRYGTPVKA